MSIKKFARTPPTMGDKLPSFKSESLGLTVYWRPDTMAVRDKYFTDLADRKMIGFAKCLFWKALNADGSRMFQGDESGNDFKTLMGSDKVEEITEIVAAMLEDVENDLTVEQAEKKSD